MQCPSSAVVDGDHSTYSTIVPDDQFLYEDVVLYTCELGFVVEGARLLIHQTVQCEASGEWSAALPVNCVRKS